MHTEILLKTTRSLRYEMEFLLQYSDVTNLRLVENDEKM